LAGTVEDGVYEGERGRELSNAPDVDIAVGSVGRSLDAFVVGKFPLKRVEHVDAFWRG